MSSFRVPSATYRIQFSLGFRFADARELVPYLHELGITDLYNSPRFKARRGSSHGYDVADPLRVNSELGTEEEYEELVQKRKHYGMGLLLDIVPNHMAASSDNPWWRDVLENGPSSAYASYFDIDWHPVSTKAAFLQDNKVLLPILGDLYGNVLENQQFLLKLDETGFFVRYCETTLPLDPRSYQLILEHFLDTLRESVGIDDPACHEVAKLLKAVNRLPGRTATDPKATQKRRRAGATIKRRLWALYHDRPEIRLCLEKTLGLFNGVQGDAKSFDLLNQLLADQAYRVAFWKLAAEEINYRRFLDISDLIGLRVEDAGVFEARHALIFELIREVKVTGLRIDHIDGLHDPLVYLQRLQAAVEPSAREQPGVENFCVIVEKILAEDESLPEEWPVCGTTGYDFLNMVNGVFVDPQGLKSLVKIYRRFSGLGEDFAEVAYKGNKQVLQELFAGEVNALAHELGKLAAQDRHARDVPLSEYIRALVEVTACLPVYRTCIRNLEISARDRKYIQQAFDEAQRRTSEECAGPPAFAFLRRVLLLEPLYYAEEKREECLRFAMRWQQFTGAAMAKGLEDTALYIYRPLVSLNEVGGNPGGSGTSVDEFHRALRIRQLRMPHTLNATSTHDTKRSEEVRARINVLSELPSEWEKHLGLWSKWNRAKKRLVNGALAPDKNDEILLYQTLIGIWPLREEEVTGLKERLEQYVIKAAREAKAHTSWLRPNPDYENALLSFTGSLLQAPEKNRFLEDFLPFQKTIAHYGALNSIAQVLLKITSPGVADFYQGTEIWDFSLVDPDNRRPVDFKLRVRLLEELRRQEAGGLVQLVHDLLAHWDDGRIKLYVTYKGLNFRKAQKDLFVNGDYVPLEVSGSRQEHVCTFARRQGSAWALIAVPRLMTKLVPAGRAPLGREVWSSTALVLPADAPKRWINVFTDETCTATIRGKSKVLSVHHAFGSFPVALLASPQNRPSAA